MLVETPRFSGTTEEDDRPVRLLIDTSPDLREQLLRHGVGFIDGLAYTHDHADQSHGIDELRSVFQNRGGIPIPTWMSQETANTLIKRFSYCFRRNDQNYPPILEARILASPHDKFLIGSSLSVEAFELRHGLLNVLGYKVIYNDRSLIYTPDVHLIPTESLSYIRGTDVWIVDCLGYKPHATHAHLDRVLEWVRALSPKMTVLTNMNITMDYDTLSSELQSLDLNMKVGFDGYRIQF